MTTTPVTTTAPLAQSVTEDEWIERFKPLPAPSGDGGFDFGDGSTLLDWTKPVDAAILDAADPACVWTVVDGDEGPAIVCGRHFVNRLGYIVTEVPTPSEDLEIVMDDDFDRPDEDEEDDD
jgi:hypothetical protein